MRQNRDLSVNSTFCQSCLVQRRWVCARRWRCCQWCLVRTWLTTGLQALSPVSLSLLRTVWALMAGLCVPVVTQAVVVAILYLSRWCDVRMYRSCAGVDTRGLSPCCLSWSVSLLRCLRRLTLQTLGLGDMANQLSRYMFFFSFDNDIYHDMWCISASDSRMPHAWTNH